MYCCLNLFPETQVIEMQNKKNQSSVGMMIQRCHKWRQKRKQYLDQARQTSDEIERERLLQAAEHYGRIVAAEQGKIDSTRTPADKVAASDIASEDTGTADDEDMALPDFIQQI